MMSPLLLQFLELLLPILETNGLSAINEHYNFSISNSGLVLLNFNLFLMNYNEIKKYLTRKRSSYVQSCLDLCMITFVGQADFKTINVKVDAIVNIKELISQNSIIMYIDQVENTFDETITISETMPIQSFSNKTFAESSEETFLSINQNQNKSDYTQSHIRDVYKEFGFQEIEIKIKALYNTKGWNPQLRSNCFDKLLQNIAKLSGVKNLEPSASTAISVCSSIKEFLAELSSYGTSSNNVRIAVNNILSACSSKSVESSRQLSRLLGVTRERRINRIRNAMHPDSGTEMDNNDLPNVIQEVSESENDSDVDKPLCLSSSEVVNRCFTKRSERNDNIKGKY